jgi:hypothetical protein
MQTPERLHAELGGQILENKEEAQRLAGQMLHDEAVILRRPSKAYFKGFPRLANQHQNCAGLPTRHLTERTQLLLPAHAGAVSFAS